MLAFGGQNGGIFRLRHIGEDCQTLATNFALAYSKVVRKQEALELTDHVAEARKKTLGDEHPETQLHIYTSHLLPRGTSTAGGAAADGTTSGSEEESAWRIHSGTMRLDTI